MSRTHWPKGPTRLKLWCIGFFGRSACLPFSFTNFLPIHFRCTPRRNWFNQFPASSITIRNKTKIVLSISKCGQKWLTRWFSGAKLNSSSTNVVAKWQNLAGRHKVAETCVVFLPQWWFLFPSGLLPSPFDWSQPVSDPLSRFWLFVAARKDVIPELYYLALFGFKSQMLPSNMGFHVKLGPSSVAHRYTA